MGKLMNRWLPVVLWATVIFLFSTIETTPTNRIHWQDFIIKKSAHIVEFAVLCTLLYRALRLSGVNRKRAAIISVLACFVYGASDEFHQSFTPGRQPTLRDVIIDTIGAIIAIYALWNILPKMPKKLRIWAEKLQLTL